MASLSALARVVPFVLVGLAACSGGGGDPAPGDPGVRTSSASVFVDTGAGSSVTLSALLSAVACERADGTLTENLLAEDTAVCLARADGASEVVTIDAVPHGAYVAMHLAFADGGVSAVDASGARVAVHPTRSTVRMAFAAPWTVGAADARCAIHHGAPLDLVTAAPGTVTWEPVLDVAPVDVLPVHFARIEVLAVDVPNQRFQGAWLAAEGRLVDVGFVTDPLLIREPSSDPLEADAFVRGLAVGSHVLVEGLIDLDDRIDATIAVDLGSDDPHGQGVSGAVEARIVALDRATQQCDIVVLEVVRGERLLPAAPRGTLHVATADARIKWVPRRGVHGGHLAFDALEVGMVVDVQWHGAVTADTIPADKIDIRSAGTTFERGFEGTLTDVSMRPRRLVLHLDEAVVIGGRTRTDVELDYTDALLVVRRSDSAVQQVTLADIVLGEPARVVFDPRGNGRFVATMVMLGLR